MPFETEDFISTMPRRCFQPELTVYSDEHLLLSDLNLDQLANDVWYKLQAGDLTGGMIVGIVERYGYATHADNVSYGQYIQSVRAKILQEARNQDIDLQAVSHDKQTLSSELAYLFQELHESATAMALKNFGLVPYLLSHDTSSFIASATIEDMQDFLQVGYLAAYQAALRYNPWRNRKNTGNPQDALHFATLAGLYINRDLKNYLPHLLPIRISPHNLEEYYLYHQIRNELKSERGTAPSHAEVAVRVYIAFKFKNRYPTQIEVDAYMNTSAKRGSLDTMKTRFLRLFEALHTKNTQEPRNISYRNGAGEWTTAEINPDEPDQAGMTDFSGLPVTDSESTLVTGMLKAEIQHVLQVLTDREKKILVMRFGLEDGKAYTLKEIAEHFKLSIESIRQIQNKALSRLRHPTRSKKLKEWYTD